MILIRTYEELQATAELRLAENTAIRNFSNGGTAKSLLEIVNSAITDAYNGLRFLADQGYVSTASDIYLDLIGDLIGIPRLGASTAISSRFEENVRFYVNSGTLKTYLGTNVIPAGTEITSLPDAMTTSVKYVTVADTTFDDLDTTVYVTVASSLAGAQSNVGKGILQVHNLNNSNIYVINDYPIINSIDRESDDQYRFRIKNGLLFMQKANRSAIESLLLTTPGVANAVVRPYTRGVGTFDAYIEPVGGGIISADIITAIQNKLESVQALGINGQIRQPTLLDTEITIQLSYRQQLSSETRSTLKAIIQNTLIDFLSNLSMGRALKIGDINRLIFDTSNDIDDVKITELKIDNKRAFIRDYTPRWNERIYPSRTATTPVRIL